MTFQTLDGKRITGITVVDGGTKAEPPQYTARSKRP